LLANAVILVHRSVCIAGKRAPTGDRRHTGAGVNPNLSASHWGWGERKTVGAGLLANALVQAHRRRLIDPVRQQASAYRSMVVCAQQAQIPFGYICILK